MQPAVIVEGHPVHHRLPCLLTGGEFAPMHAGGFHVAGFGAALLGSLIYSVLGLLIESALGGLFLQK